MMRGADTADGPLGILCGGGSIPFAIADTVIASGRQVVLFPLIGWADPVAVKNYAHEWIHVGQFGRFCNLARAAGVRDVVFIGMVLRPALHQVRLDWRTIQIFPRIIQAFRGGDDHLLSGIGKIFEDHGFRLLGAHQVAPEIVMREGALGRRVPTTRDQSDIARGLAVLAATGAYDIGQAVVVADGHVLALEAAEGTDRMLARVAELRRDQRIRARAGAGVLVKAPKPTQDRRYDLPTVGPDTVEGAARAGLAGVAIAAGAAIVVDPQKIGRLADQANLFVVGIKPGAAS